MNDNLRDVLVLGYLFVKRFGHHSLNAFLVSFIIQGCVMVFLEKR